MKKKMMNLLLLPRTQPMVQIVPPLLITMMRERKRMRMRKRTKH